MACGSLYDMNLGCNMIASRSECSLDPYTAGTSPESHEPTVVSAQVRLHARDQPKYRFVMPQNTRILSLEYGLRANSLTREKQCRSNYDRMLGS